MGSERDRERQRETERDRERERRKNHPGGMNEAAWQQVVKAIENIDKKEKTSSETNRGKGRSPVTVSRFDRSTRGRQRFHPIITNVVAE